jgi:hypothetical protein
MALTKMIKDLSGVIIHAVKDNLAAAGNAVATVGVGTGFWSFLSENSSQITVIIVMLTMVITAVAHYFDKKIKSEHAKIQRERLEFDIEKDRADRELARQQLNLN